MSNWFPVLLILCLLWAQPAQAAMKAALLLEHENTLWTDLLRQGFTEGTKAHGMKSDVVIISPAAPQKDRVDQFRQTARDHDVVIVASEGIYDLLRDNAANFRRVKFGSVDAGIRAPNIMSVTFADEQAAFLAGALAATMAAQKNANAPTIGWLSGVDVPALRSLFSGYREGAILERPGCRVIQALVGSFVDGARAAAKMQWLIDSGATVVALAAGGGNAEVRRIARERGVDVIDLDAPQDETSLGAIVKAVPRAVKEILAAAAGSWRGKEIIVYDLANGGVDFLPRAHVDGRRIKELRHELESGSIKLHSLRQRTLCDCLD